MNTYGLSKLWQEGNHTKKSKYIIMNNIFRNIPFLVKSHAIKKQ